MAKPTKTFSLESYAPDARAWVGAAQELADARENPTVEPLHLLVVGLTRDPGVREVFRAAGAVPDTVLRRALAMLAEQPSASESAFLSGALVELLSRAEQEAKRAPAGQVSVEDVLHSLTQVTSGATLALFAEFKLGPGSLAPFMGKLRSVPRPVAKATRETKHEFVRDLVALAKGGALDPVVGRAATIRRVLTILERRAKGNPVLVGETGVGKSAVLRGVAQRVAVGDAPARLVKGGLHELVAGTLSAGTRVRSEAASRVRRILDGFPTQGGDGSVLVVPSVTRLLVGPGNLADLFLSLLHQGQLRLLATATPEEWNKVRSEEPQLASYLTPVVVEPASVGEAQEITRAMASQFESHHRVNIQEAAVRSAVELANKYLADRALPDSCLDLLDEAAASARVSRDGYSPELDDRRAELASLQLQIKSLEGAQDETSRHMGDELRQRSSELEPAIAVSEKSVARRRAAVAALRDAAVRLQGARERLTSAKSENNYAALGELEHSIIPNLEEAQKNAELSLAKVGGEPGPVTVDESHVARTLAQWTGIPVAKMLEAEVEKLLKMEERLAARVVGQQDAVRAVARAVRRGRAGLRDPNKPIGSFLFLGTSGVGKTELAKALAEFLFDDEAALTRLDMSEFMERHMAQRLLGAPPGYADSESGGFLTEAVRRKPYSVLLFDEVEKAHQDVFNLLLQVLDDGRLTDGRGRLADFTNTVVIMTSNIGSERVLEAPAEQLESETGRAALRESLFANLRDFFRPEFLNRVGETVVFRPLSKQDLGKIVDIQLRNVEGMLAARDLRISVSPAAKAELVNLGYEPALGARPLQRAIVKHLQDPLAEQLLQGHFEKGTTVNVELRDGQLNLVSSAKLLSSKD